ncbi:MAG TPA: 2OG-Fe(II) oxygenase [Acidobacteriota bacterium]|nr:2OG-Fe(II) oxygenase [Acidobacteriota bacterium]
MNERILLEMFVLGQKFRQNPPFPHILLEPFFQPEFARELLHSFPQFDPKNAKNELGLVGGKAVQPDVRSIGTPYKKLDDMARSDDFLKFLSGVTGIPDLLYDPAYQGGGTHENLSGQELDPHVDFNFHPYHEWHRRLNLIIYLNEEWKESWGGCLELHSNPWSQDKNVVKQFLPLMNRAILFETSNHSWHGFKKIQLPDSGKSRKSIALYFYTQEKDGVPSATRHTTFYVHRQLPETMKAGHTLTEEDVNELKSLLIKRDTWIKYLYERELVFSDQFSKFPVVVLGVMNLAYRILDRTYKFVSPLWRKKKVHSKDKLQP